MFLDLQVHRDALLNSSPQLFKLPPMCGESLVQFAHALRGLLHVRIVHAGQPPLAGVCPVQEEQSLLAAVQDFLKVGLAGKEIVCELYFL